MLIWVGGRLLLTGVNLTSKTFLSLTSFIAAPYAGIKFTMIPKLNIPELTARKNMIFFANWKRVNCSGCPLFCNFRTRKSYKLRDPSHNKGSLTFVSSPYFPISETENRKKEGEPLQNKGTLNKGPSLWA